MSCDEIFTKNEAHYELCLFIYSNGSVQNANQTSRKTYSFYINVFLAIGDLVLLLKKQRTCPKILLKIAHRNAIEPFRSEKVELFRFASKK